MYTKPADKQMNYDRISSINSTCQHEVKELNKRYSMDTHSTHVGSLLNISCDWWVILKDIKQIGRGIKLKEFTKDIICLTNSQLKQWEQKLGGNNFYPISIISYLGSLRNGLLQNRFLELKNML